MPGAQQARRANQATVHHGRHPHLAPRLLRPASRRSAGIAGANTAADHVEVTDLALAQIPDSHRYGTPILVRADGAGGSKRWLAVTL
jgi:hypothetical protein